MVIYKNISDVIEIKENRHGLNLLKKLRLIFQAKKNPILLTILTENLITFTSTTIPILCQMLFYLSPATLWGVAGGLLIGAIQL